jgi:SAM-dependent methyltransferase
VTANFTRRRDLFLDTGFADPDAVLASVTAEALRLAPPSDWSAMGPALRRSVVARLERVPPAQLRLARLAPEWLGERSGDLATVLWLARSEHGEALDVSGFLLAIFGALLEAPLRERDAVAFARFVFDLHYDWDRVYADPGLAYEFRREREPNPLVWRVLDQLRRQGAPLEVLELGCGIGNDALGFFESGRVQAYTGIDVSEEALEAFRRRVERDRVTLKPALLRGDFLDVLERLPPELSGVNLVYSYSSLHYFNSHELTRIFELVHRLLARPGSARGAFAFGIKGAGSIWEGQGLPVYRPDVWVNWDGQSRWFPAREALQRQLDRAGFEIFFHELHEHWSYSERGKRDVFHYVLCAPRPA